jgi:hypothetical protein
LAPPAKISRKFFSPRHACEAFVAAHAHGIQKKPLGFAPLLALPELPAY